MLINFAKNINLGMLFFFNLLGFARGRDEYQFLHLNLKDALALGVRTHEPQNTKLNYTKLNSALGYPGGA